MLNLIKIGKYITHLRNEKQMSQQELADALYVTHQAVSKWENGKSIPNIEIMAELTKLFNITIDELIYGGERVTTNDFPAELNLYPRNYVIHQLITGKYVNVKISDVLYLLNDNERELIITHIINNNLKVDICELLPYLNNIERKRLINAILTKKIPADIDYVYHMLSQNEKMYLRGTTN